MLKITRGIITIKCQSSNCSCFFSVHQLMMLYICTQVSKNVLNTSEEDTITIFKITKGYNSVKNIDGATVLVGCILPFKM